LASGIAEAPVRVKLAAKNNRRTTIVALGHGL
jgi:hypothetical protein